MVVIDVNCHEIICEDALDLDTYKFEVTITALENGHFVPVPEQVYMHHITAACYRILADSDNRSRLDVRMSEAVRDRVTEAEWILAALTVL